MSEDVDTRPYFEGLDRGEIFVQRCPACGAHQFPPRAICVRCGGTPDWVPIEGRGVIYAVTTCHRPGAPWLESRAPYSVALVDFPEQVRMLGRIAGDPVEHGAIGAAVRPVFTRDPQGLPAVEFELVTGGPSAADSPEGAHERT